MKITDVRTIVLRQPEISMIGDGSQDTIVIMVHTDKGITGIGEVDSSPYVIQSIIHTPASHMVCQGLKEVIIGEDPFNVEKIWHKMYNLSYYYGRRSVGIHAMSGIDMAIWDIIGQALEVPIYKLLGGSFRDKVPAYCSVLMPDDEDEIKRLVDVHMPRGFKGMKFGWGALGQSRENDIRLVRAAREALGPYPYLMIDIGMAWRDVKTAIQMCDALSEFQLNWIEEPIIPDDLLGYKRLCASVNTKISAGEEVGTLYEFKELIDECCIDIIQPDISRCGGFSVARKVVDMATLRNVPVIPHAFKTGILMSASLHLLSAMPRALFLEYCSQETVLSKTLIHNHFVPDSEGYVHIPQEPGLGIQIDEDVVNRYAMRCL